MKYHQGPCPQCSSSDAYTMYEDGHGYCFSCHYYSPGSNNVEYLKKQAAAWSTRLLGRYQQMATDTRSLQEIDPYKFNINNYSSVIDKKALVWLRKYGITDSEIKGFRFLWNHKTSSLVFPFYDNSGKIILTNERYFGENKDFPKYITHGNKSTYLYWYTPNRNCPSTHPDVGIIVEDIVSAIRVGRYFLCMPLLGSTMPVGASKTVYNKCKRARVWLDMDKASASIVEASKLSQWGEARSIVTLLDPKEYSDEEIKKKVLDTL